MNSGFLLIDKEKDWTSFDVVKKLRGILKIKKTGHIGTLDPFATGLLIILFNKANAVAQFITQFDKEYIVTSKFDIMTDTGDSTGNIIKEDKDNTILSKNDFVKKIDEIYSLNKQIPSKFSAIKINGQKAYKLAHSGKEVQMPERYIVVRKFELLEYNYPLFTWKVEVSKGTYIRTLTEQIAGLFGKIATTVDLRRTKIADFDVKNALKITQVNEDTEFFPLEDLLYQVPRLSLSDEQIKMFSNGRSFAFEYADIDKIQIYDLYGKFIGIAKIINNTLKAFRVLNA